MIDNFFTIHNVQIGAGIPNICVSITGITREEILEKAQQIISIGTDIVEWRVDWYEHASDLIQVQETARQLREVLNSIPLLFTFRTLEEGGEQFINPQYYVSLNKEIARTQYVDMLDIELYTGDEAVRQVITIAHSFNVKVIVSNHDFHKTPSKDELIHRLQTMQNLGADIPKIAVMPQNKNDVLVLLSATEEMYRSYADRPIVTMSMSPIGMISRFSGEIFGSALTFGSIGRSSAPGQIEVTELRSALSFIHHNL